MASVSNHCLHGKYIILHHLEKIQMIEIEWYQKGHVRPKSQLNHQQSTMQQHQNGQ